MLSISFGNPSGVSASMSSVSVILVPRTRSSSLRIDWAMLLTCGVGRFGGLLSGRSRINPTSAERMKGGGLHRCRGVLGLPNGRVSCKPRSEPERLGAYGRASRTILNGVSAARRTLPNPPLRMTSLSFASPAWAPRPALTSCDNEVGRQIMVEAA